MAHALGIAEPPGTLATAPSDLGLVDGIHQESDGVRRRPRAFASTSASNAENALGPSWDAGADLAIWLACSAR